MFKINVDNYYDNQKRGKNTNEAKRTCDELQWDTVSIDVTHDVYSPIDRSITVIF